MSRAARWILAAALAGGPGMAAYAVAQDAEASKTAKALFFDRQYGPARTAWGRIASSGGSEGVTALYWIAQCSEKLGEDERALAEYAQYLTKRPAGQLAEDARTSRVRIATKLAKAGKNQHLGIAIEGLSEPSRTVRYYAALQLCGLGLPRGKEAIPVLHNLVAGESDTDLVERAKLCLVKLGAAHEAQTAAARADGGWFRVEIVKDGKKQVAISMPLGLADLVLKSLPDDARAELRRKGFDSEGLMGNLQAHRGKEIVNIVGDDGEQIRIWIE